MSEGPVDGADFTMSPRTKAIAWVVGVVLLLGSAYLMLRMSSPAIPLGSTPPAGHFPFDCAICHRLVPIPPSAVKP